MKPGSRTTFAVAALLALGVLGCSQPTEQTTLEFRASVSAEPVRKGGVERLLTTTGTVRPRREASVVAETAGKLRIARNPLTKDRFAVGDEVKRGQVVASVDPKELRTSSRTAARKTALAAAEAEHARNLKMYEEGLISELQLSEYETRVANSEADYENALLQEAKGRIESPLSGVLTSVLTAADDTFANAGTSVATVMDFDSVFVDLDLGTSEVLDVKAGQAVRVRSYSSPLEFEGRVERIAPAIDSTSRTFRVEVLADNPERRLRPGMFVRAEIVLDSRADVPVIPTDAVLNRGGRWVVFVVEAQRAQEREVEIGLVSEETVEVLDGLNVGEKVVVTGQDTLQDGARVLVRS
jgi:RND family efflux transporter MFP subunit